jgi:hypothetical protein
VILDVFEKKVVLGVPIMACAEPSLNDYIDSVFKSIHPELTTVLLLSLIKKGLIREIIVLITDMKGIPQGKYSFLQ